MKEQKLYARAKINLGLDVLRRRPDGYHDLRMVMQTVNLCDEIILRTSDAAKEGPERISLCCQISKKQPGSRQSMPGVSGWSDMPSDSRNLAFRAAQLLMEEFDIREGLEIVLKKRIPVAAGLAGGSADAAAVLIGMNGLFSLNLSEQELMARGVKLGADVPYCIMGGTALAEGIGERLTRLPDAPLAYVLLAKPPISVSTKEVYEGLGMDRADGHGQDSLQHPDIDAQVRAVRSGDFYRMAALMGNVLETVTVPAFPVVGEIKEQMSRCGAVNAMMSGSGPTVFGLFDDREKAERAYETVLAGNLAETVFLTMFSGEDRSL